MATKYLKFGLMAVIALAMASCIKNVDTNDEKKIAENEAAINKYILDSAWTDKVTRESTGLIYYKRQLNPGGDLAKTGDAATLKIHAYLLNGTKVLSTGDSTITIPVDGYTSLGGVELGVKIMRTGEKSTFLVPFYLGWGANSTSSIPAYSPLRLEVEFMKTRTEVQQIDEYLAKKQYVVSERTADNLVIIRTNTVTGDTLGSGKAATVKYVGRFLDGTKFDEGSLNFNTNTNAMIQGFDRAVRKMRKTEKIIVIFPSSLGYGKNCQGCQTSATPILPYSPLQFEIELQ